MPLGFRASSTPNLRSVLAIRHAPTDHTPGNWRIPRLALEPIIDCGSSRETLAMAIPLQGCGTDRKARDAGEKYAKLDSDFAGRVSPCRGSRPVRGRPPRPSGSSRPVWPGGSQRVCDLDFRVAALDR